MIHLIVFLSLQDYGTICTVRRLIGTDQVTHSEELLESNEMPKSSHRKSYVSLHSLVIQESMLLGFAWGSQQEAAASAEHETN